MSYAGPGPGSERGHRGRTTHPRARALRAIRDGINDLAAMRFDAIPFDWIGEKFNDGAPKYKSVRVQLS
jgi:hypothetical protein